jgi:uncharacterized protein
MLKKVGCSHIIIQHCINVSNLAVNMAKKLHAKGVEVDIALIEIGGLLHDIGRSKTHTIRHAVIGAQIIVSLNLPISLVNIVERHVGSGIPKEEAVKLGLPNRDFIPHTIEEKLVSYADKLIDGNREMNFKEALTRFIEDLGKSHPAIERFKKIHLELMRMSENST